MCVCVCQNKIVHVLYVYSPLGRLHKERFSAFIPWLIYVVMFAFVPNLITGKEEEQRLCLLCMYLLICVSVFANLHAEMLL